MIPRNFKYTGTENLPIEQLANYNKVFEGLSVDQILGLRWIEIKESVYTNKDSILIFAIISIIL